MKHGLTHGLTRTHAEFILCDDQRRCWKALALIEALALIAIIILWS